MNEPLLRRVLGDILRRTRHEQRRTLSNVATSARVSMPYLSEVERGLKEASSEVLAAICRALEISVGDLVAQAHEEFSALRAFSGVHELSAITLEHDPSRAASSSFDPGTTLLLAA